MTSEASSESVSEVAVVEATAVQRDVVAQLLELNAYEFSRFDGRGIGEDGRYGYRWVDAYWSEPGLRVPYLIWVEGELAGLALVRSDQATTWLAEFLVLPKFRRGGVGTSAAQLVFAQHGGPWRVEQLRENESATLFWRRAIPYAYAEHVDATGAIVQTFSVD